MTAYSKYTRALTFKNVFASTTKAPGISSASSSAVVCLSGSDGGGGGDMSVDSLGGRVGGSLHSQNGASGCKVVVPHWGDAMDTCKAALKARILNSVLCSGLI